MALPKHSETERGLELQKIVNSTNEGEIFHWPNPTPDDYAAFGEIMWLYTGLDFVLRMVAEVMDSHDILQPPYKGKVASFSIKRTTDAILSSPMWQPSHRQGFEDINEGRRLRNLIGHFVAKRFVKEDAFIFMTKSADDYAQVYGTQPPSNHMLYGVIEASQVYGAVPRIRKTLEWSEKLPRDLSKPIQGD
jgi:hypothetical protein